jgi:hypothetical protein
MTEAQTNLNNNGPKVTMKLDDGTMVGLPAYYTTSNPARPNTIEVRVSVPMDNSSTRRYINHSSRGAATMGQDAPKTFAEHHELAALREKNVQLQRDLYEARVEIAKLKLEKKELTGRVQQKSGEDFCGDFPVVNRSILQEDNIPKLVSSITGDFCSDF